MRRAYTVFAAAVVAVYAASVVLGFELGSARRGFVPPGVRQSPGGYRSYHFWRGGK